MTEPSETRTVSRTGTIVTPCIKVCAVEPLSGLCIGCGRTLREIGGWASFSPDARDRIMAVLPDRLARLRQTAPDAFME
ncbi:MULTISPECIES: DUF1289 domain-containing protein [Xanthobacter]|jgi:predicted Fe-S protein YdhL (DUF1289 family)|uniref:DUF1289 domain-containing protein n=1 Tax=Xanthobacter TaxID=279 RepID=UPI0004B5B4C0|nr:DUF1289 domain-containing protein [Xanthobacter aminoxidans]